MTIQPEKSEKETPEAASQLSRDDDVETELEDPGKTKGEARDPSPHIDDAAVCELGEGTRITSHLPPPSPTYAETERNPGVVPRLHRRGLLANLVLIPEAERPREYSNRVKWIITAFTAAAGAAAPMGSAM